MDESGERRARGRYRVTYKDPEEATDERTIERAVFGMRFDWRSLRARLDEFSRYPEVQELRREIVENLERGDGWT